MPEKRYPLPMAVPASVELLHRAFKQAGYKLYVVGGAVRDLVLSFFQHKPFHPKDYDLVTNALPQSVEQILTQAKAQGLLPPQIEVRGVGAAFGVMLVAFGGGEDYEIATFRKDAKTSKDSRRPDFVTFSTMPEDADRRDLSINALYYDLDTKEVIDFHDGVEHLQQNLVQFVGNPRERLKEDKLRALRFARFHGRVSEEGPESMEDRTVEAIRQVVLHPEISGERIHDELFKGLKSALHLQNFILNLDHLGLLQQCFPGLTVTKDLQLERLGGMRVPLTVLIAQLLRKNDVNLLKNQLNNLKYTNKEVDDIAFLVKLPLYRRADQIVDFKKDRRRSTLRDEIIIAYRRVFGLNDLIDVMLAFPYPSVSSQELINQGFAGEKLGREIKSQEIKNFDKFLSDGSPAV